MIERKNPRTARVGFYSVAHATYWDQFPGLLDNMMVYHNDTIKLVESYGVEVIDYGMIDSSEKAYEAVAKMQGDKLDVLFTNMITYATSSVFAPIVREMNIPVVLVALQPLKALDYNKACTFMQLENDNICSVPEFTGVAIRMGKKVDDVIIGTLYDENDPSHAELSEWCEIAKVLHSLKGARMGLMGHVLEAMYDMHADPTAISSAFGVHVPLIEIDDAVACFEAVTDEEIAAKTEIIKAEFEMPDPKSDPVTRKLTDKDLYESARGAAALDRLVEKFGLSGLAYYYEGQPDTIQRRVATSFIVGNSILNAQGTPMCGELI